MAINKPVKKGTKQRFSKTENITAGVGDYGNKKSFNLTKKQLGASGAKAASTRKIAISRTEYKNGKVYGPMGKPITGRVDMGGGNIAVYKNGVRVTAKKASAAKPSSSGSGSGGGAGGGSKGGGNSGSKMIDRGPRMQADRNPRPKPRGDSGTNRGPLLQGERKPKPVDMAAPYRSGNTRPLPGVTAKERAINNKPRPYPSRQFKKESDQIGERALIMASLLPGIGVATRVGMGVRAGAAGMKALGAGAKGAKAIGPRAPRAATGSPKAIEARATTGGAKISYGRPKPSGPPSRGLTEKGGPTKRPATTRPPKDAALAKYEAKLTPAQKGARTRAANAAKKKG